jgi:hypothetical protein
VIPLDIDYSTMVKQYLFFRENEKTFLLTLVSLADDLLHALNLSLKVSNIK